MQTSGTKPELFCLYFTFIPLFLKSVGGADWQSEGLLFKNFKKQLLTLYFTADLIRSEATAP